MANFNFRLDLSKLEGYGEITLTGNSGVPTECIVIPKKLNNIFNGKNGVYLDIVFWESQNSKYGDTHYAVRSKSSDEQAAEKLSGERKKLPILGNLKPFGQQAANAETYTLPAAGQPAAPAAAPAAAAPAGGAKMPKDNDTDLPF